MPRKVEPEIGRNDVAEPSSRTALFKDSALAKPALENKSAAGQVGRRKVAKVGKLGRRGKL
jgi:hypothetical protein